MPEYEVDDDGLPRRVMKADADKAAQDKRRREAAKKAAEARKRARVGGNAPKAKTNRQSKRESRTIINDKSSGQDIAVYHEKLPNSGTITLMNPEEVAYFRDLKKRYEEDYTSLLQKPNDRNRLSQLLSFELTAHRMTQRMMGQVTQYNEAGEVVGIELVDASEIASITQNLPKVQDEIRKLESALKIDKRTREGSGEGDVRRYMETLKRAAIQYKVHISGRYTAFDNFVNELRWRMRVMANPDAEDRAYHGLESPEKLMEWINQQLEELDGIDKDFTKDKQSLWVGKI